MILKKVKKKYDQGWDTIFNEISAFHFLSEKVLGISFLFRPSFCGWISGRRKHDYAWRRARNYCATQYCVPLAGSIIPRPGGGVECGRDSRTSRGPETSALLLSAWVKLLSIYGLFMRIHILSKTSIRRKNCLTLKIPYRLELTIRGLK